MIDWVILSIDRCLGYSVMRGINVRRESGKMRKKDLLNFYEAKELIRRYDYYVTNNEEYRRQYWACMSRNLFYRMKN